MFHYVYRITNTSSNKHYYGKRSCNILPKNDLGVKYFSSSHDELFIRDQKQNPQNYKYKIIRVFDTSKDALSFEIRLHNKFDVGINENFYNKSKQTSVRFCFSVSGEKHPMYGQTGVLNPLYGKTHSDATKQKMSEKQSGKGNPQFGTMWVTNGAANLKIKKTDNMPDGFCKGRVKKNLCF